MHNLPATIADCLAPFAPLEPEPLAPGVPAITHGQDPDAEGYATCYGRTAKFRFITENPYTLVTIASEQWRGGWMRAYGELREKAGK